MPQGCSISSRKLADGSLAWHASTTYSPVANFFPLQNEGVHLARCAAGRRSPFAGVHHGIPLKGGPGHQTAHTSKASKVCPAVREAGRACCGDHGPSPTGRP